MMYIYDGRQEFVQWDINVKIADNNFKIGDEVHFFNNTTYYALVVKTYQEGDVIVADVPNILLQAPNPIRAMHYIQHDKSEYTIDEATFKVIRRPKPSDYIYTETNIIDIKQMANNIEEELKNSINGVSVPLMELIDKEVENDPNYKFAYDFAGKYDRVYVEQSSGGWNGHGGNVYNKYVISSDGSPVYDPDFKDYKVDENGKPCGEKLNSIPMRMAHGFMRVPPYTKEQIKALGLSDYEVSKLTAPIAYVDEARALAESEAREYADNIKTKLEGEINGAANAVIHKKTDSLLVLDDINPLANSIAVHSEEGGTSIVVCGNNFAHSDTITSTSTLDWAAARMNVYIPKNRKYIFSADFENVTGLKVGIAVKPDNRSSSWWKSVETTESAGSLSLEIEAGDYDKFVTLCFYSNSTKNAVYSKCIFSNIVFRLADMDVPAGTKGIAPILATTDTESKDVTVPVPDVDTVLVFNLEEKELAATYFVDTNKYLEEKDSITAKRLSEIDKADWVEDAVPQEWIDTEISQEDFPWVEGQSAWKVRKKSKGKGFAYDFDEAYNRVCVERSGGRGQYAKYVLTANPIPVPDPDYKDWDIVRDDDGNIVSMTPKMFNDSIPMRLGKLGHIRVPKDISAYDALTGDARRMAATSVNFVETKDAEILAKIPSPAKNGHWAYTVNKNSSGETPMNILISHGINGSYSSQIPLRTGGIIKTATPKASDDCANKDYVDNLVSSIPNVDLTDYLKKEEAFSGAYADLTGKPTIPTKVSSVTSGSTNVPTGDAVYDFVTDKEKTLSNSISALETRLTAMGFKEGALNFNHGEWSSLFSIAPYNGENVLKKYGKNVVGELRYKITGNTICTKENMNIGYRSDIAQELRPLSQDNLGHGYLTVTLSGVTHYWGATLMADGDNIQLRIHDWQNAKTNLDISSASSVMLYLIIGYTVS